jgi:hypothetical protein
MATAFRERKTRVQKSLRKGKAGVHVEYEALQRIRWSANRFKAGL